MAQSTNKHLGSRLHDDGVDFAVWAPFAQNVALLQWLEFEWSELPMESDGNGYWFIKNVQAEAGQMYKYRITTQTG